MPYCFIPEVSLVLFIGVGYIQGCEFKHKFSSLSSHLSAGKKKDVKKLLAVKYRSVLLIWNNIA
jgi:hypothetical protein